MNRNDTEEQSACLCGCEEPDNDSLFSAQLQKVSGEFVQAVNASIQVEFRAEESAACLRPTEKGFL